MFAFLKKNLNDPDGLFIPKLVVTMRDYSWKQFRADAGAGVVVGLVALPLAMAFAIASGLPPERGLYTAIVAGFLISLLGGSRVQIGGPTGAFVVIVGGIVAKFGYQGLVLATLMAGVLLLLMGLFRLGKLVKFIPYPVITGFTSGIAVIIFSSQIKDLLGLRMGAVPIDFLDKWVAYAHNFTALTPYACVIGLGTAAMIYFWPKAWQKLPGSIVALTIFTALAHFLGWPVETIASRFGHVPRHLPPPSFPSISWPDVKLLFPSALTVAALGSIESLLSAVVADGMIGGRHRSNQELLAQGIANLASPLFGGLPATGAIARTATNVKNGGRTPVAGMIHAVVLFLVLMLAAPFAEHIPLAALSGVLIVVAYHMSEWQTFRLLMSGPGSDKVVLLATFLLTVFVDLVAAVEVGMVMAAFLFMKNMAELTEVRAMTAQIGGTGADVVRAGKIPVGVEVFSIRGAFFFAAVHKLMEVDRIMQKQVHTLVLDMRDVLHIDASGLHVLRRLQRECRARNIQVVISGLNPQNRSILADSGLEEAIGVANLTPDLATALSAVSPAA